MSAQENVFSIQYTSSQDSFYASYGNAKGETRESRKRDWEGKGKGWIPSIFDPLQKRAKQGSRPSVYIGIR